MKDATGCLRTTEAAAYLGLAPQTLCNYRARDRKLVANGEPPLGPRFLLICNGNVCVYRVADLDAWLEASSRTATRGQRFAGKNAGAR